MSIEVGKAVLTRWDATGLDTSIAELYGGSKGVTSRRNIAGSPAEQNLPRAEYSLEQSSVVRLSRGSRVFRQPVRFQVWYSGMQSAGEAVDLIADKFVNSERAGTNPFILPSTVGKVLGVDYGTSATPKQDDEIFQGVLEIHVIWREANTIPA